MKRILVIAICAALTVAAQDSPELATAKAMDLEIRKLKNSPDDARPRAIQDLALRIRQQPPKFAIALASNLAQDSIEASDRTTLQTVADTLADLLRTSPETYRFEGAYANLAALARYHGAAVSMDDPRYAAAMAKFVANDRARAEVDFTLTDLQGRKWNLKSLRGKVVLVNFWATWCAPCLRELPELAELHRRFQNQGLVILAISDEESATVKSFVGMRKIDYTMLLDPDKQVASRFLVNGIPQTFVYNREGRLVAQVHNRPSMQGFLEMLRLAGLE